MKYLKISPNPNRRLSDPGTPLVDTRSFNPWIAFKTVIMKMMMMMTMMMLMKSHIYAYSILRSVENSQS